ncbi:probable pectinesterase 29 [Hibiscus syriacus]|uniref:probable pectinesterase 29 n=1 Tax=Hibiscus syriacus TaxID=106335 RepID=UPI001921E822|nr:probable pectinesterase 29 [Hibiscus syriacus]
MQQPFSSFLYSCLLVLALFLSAKADDRVRQIKDEISNTIVVDQSGHGNFTNIQNAIDSIPTNNEVWTLVHVKPGTYMRVGGSTIIQFADGGDSVKRSTFSSYADDFVATDIAFKSTCNLQPGKPITWALAALINANKASFYQCRFISVQDTLKDSQGRHYFEQCYIEGGVDFIWAVTARGSLAGYITAQARDSAANHSGFMFKDGSIVGTGPVYLGRAYRPYARVLFQRTKMSDIIIPTGWSAWSYVGKE